MDFGNLIKNEEGLSFNPYAAKVNDEWLEGTILVDFLNANFGHLETAEEMINATESEGLKLYFAWLRDQGILD